MGKQTTFDSTVASVGQQFSTVLGAPIPFLLVVGIVGFAIWVVVKHLKANQIENLESRLKLRDDEIADYKRKLEGATPDEAADRIDRLERELAAIKPRGVSPEQVDIIAAALKGIGGSVSLRQDMAYADGRNITSGLQRAFEQAGWNVYPSMVLGIGVDVPSGIGIGINDAAQIDPPHRAICLAFDAAGIKYDCDFDPRWDRDCVQIQVTAPIAA